MMDYSSLIASGTAMSIRQRERLNQKKQLHETIESLGAELKQLQVDLDDYMCACNLVGNVSDAITQETLDRITGVINKALGVLFPSDARRIRIVKQFHNDVYPHFLVELQTGNGTVRSFKQSGSGLAQTISILFNLCLIDARGGRKLVVMDELLGCLHPDAKGVLAELMLALTDRFQFIFVEYGLDIGKQYLVSLTGDTATVAPYEATTTGYYTDLVMDKYNRKMSAETS